MTPFSPFILIRKLWRDCEYGLNHHGSQKRNLYKFILSQITNDSKRKANQILKFAARRVSQYELHTIESNPRLHQFQVHKQT